MSSATRELDRRLDDLRSRNAIYCGQCLREDVPTTVDSVGPDGREYRICGPCKLYVDRGKAARETADPLVLEYIRTRRALIREHDADVCGSIETDIDADYEPSEVAMAGWEAKRQLIAFLGGTYAAGAVVDALDHHFAADYSEIHGYGQTLTFTNELDRVILADGKDSFQRYVDEHPEDGVAE